MRISLVALLACGCGRLGFDSPAPAVDASVTVDESRCAPRPVTGLTQVVASVAELEAALSSAGIGTTILVADGIYSLGGTLVVGDGITVRSQSGDASSVELVASAATPVIELVGSGSSLISLTVRGGFGEGIQVEPAGPSTTGTLIYDVTVIDNALTGVRVRPKSNMYATGPYADDGTVACSRFISSSAATGCDPGTGAWAINADAARGWTIPDNIFDHRACPTGGTLFRTGHFDTDSRHPVPLATPFLDTNLGILLGGATPLRTYPDALPAGCGTTPDHWGGLVCNNVISAPSPPPAPAEDFTEGIALWTACDTYVMHNTVATQTGAEVFTNIEYRYAGTYVHLINNLSALPPTQRQSGVQDTAWESSNMTFASLGQFVDPASGDLRAQPGMPLPKGLPITSLDACTTDILGRPRDLVSPTIGAFEP